MLKNVSSVVFVEISTPILVDLFVVAPSFSVDNTATTVEHKGFQLLEACRLGDSTAVKRLCNDDTVNFKHPFTHDTAIVRVVVWSGAWGGGVVVLVVVGVIVIVGFVVVVV